MIYLLIIVIDSNIKNDDLATKTLIQLVSNFDLTIFNQQEPLLIHKNCDLTNSNGDSTNNTLAFIIRK